MNCGRLDEAVAAFETAVRLDPKHYAAIAHLARLKLQQDRLEEAQQLVETLGRHFPDDAVAPLISGLLAIKRDEPHAAMDYLSTAVRLDSRSPLPRWLLGMVALGLGRGRDAISHLKAAARLDSRSPALHRALGVAYATQGDSAHAIKALKTSLALDPMGSATVHALARVLFDTGQRQAAVNILADYLSRRPNDAIAHELLAKTYASLDEFRAVRRHLLRAIETLSGANSDAEVAERARLMNDVGVACVLGHELKEAEQWFRRSLNAFPLPLTFQNLYGLCIQRNDFTAAHKAVLHWRDVFPSDNESKVWLAASYSHLGNVDRAVFELRELLEANPKIPRAYAVLGSLLSDHLHDFESAIEVLNQGQKEFPNDTGIANNLAYAYLMQGSTTPARLVLEQISSEERSNSVFLTATYGLLHLWEGDVSSAIRLYRAAEDLAKQKHQRRLSETVQQKMRLELARHYVRCGQPQNASIEVKHGLALTGRRQYREDLLQLRRLLTA
jgi:tetratricopeptide (TPR) repeat protein